MGGKVAYLVDQTPPTLAIAFAFLNSFVTKVDKE